MADHIADACEKYGHDSGLAWSVGECSRSVDVPAPTLRTWDRRYGVGPSARTDGGHRRYTCEDIDRLRLMKDLLSRGVNAHEAGAHVNKLEPDTVHETASQLLAV